MCTDWEGKGNVSALLDSTDGNLTSDGLWTHPWDADGARQRVDGAPQCGVPGAKRRVRKTGAPWADDEQNRLTAMTMKTGLPTGMIRKRLEFKYDYLGRRVEKKVLNNWTGTTGTTVSPPQVRLRRAQPDRGVKREQQHGLIDLRVGAGLVGHDSWGRGRRRAAHGQGRYEDLLPRLRRQWERLGPAR